MTAAEFTPGAYLLLEGPALREEVHLVAVAPHGLQIRRAGPVATPRDTTAEETVPWTALERVSVPRPRGRAWGVPLALGAVGALALGSCGAVLDALGRSTQGALAPRDPLTPSTAGIGFCLGALVGCVVIFSRSRSRWEVVYEAPRLAAETSVVDPEGVDASAPLALDERLERGAREVARNAEQRRVRRMRESVLAWVIFAALILALYLWGIPAAHDAFSP